LVSLSLKVSISIVKLTLVISGNNEQNPFSQNQLIKCLVNSWHSLPSFYPLFLNKCMTAVSPNSMMDLKEVHESGNYLTGIERRQILKEPANNMMP